MTSTNARKHAPAIQTDDVLRMLQQHHHAAMQLPCAFIGSKDYDTSVVDMHSAITSIDASLQLSALHGHIDVLNKEDDIHTASAYADPCAFNDYACNSILQRQQHSYTSHDTDASSASLREATDTSNDAAVDATATCTAIAPVCALASTASDCMPDYIGFSQLDVPHVAKASVDLDAEDQLSHSSERAQEAMSHSHQQCQITYTSKDNTPILFHSEPHSIRRLSAAIACGHSAATASGDAAAATANGHSAATASGQSAAMASGQSAATASGQVAAATREVRADTASAAASTVDAVDTSSKAVLTDTASDSSSSSGACADARAVAAKAKALANAREQHYAQMHKMHVDAIQSAYAYASALSQAHKMQEKLSMLHGQLKEKLTAEHMLEQVKDSHLAEQLHHKNEAYERHSSHHDQQLQPSVAQLNKEHCI